MAKLCPRGKAAAKRKFKVNKKFLEGPQGIYISYMYVTFGSRYLYLDLGFQISKCAEASLARPLSFCGAIHVLRR